MWVKKFAIFLLVLLVVCSCAWAFPGRKATSPEGTQMGTQTVQKEPKTIYGMTPQSALTTLSTSLEKIEEKEAEKGGFFLTEKERTETIESLELAKKELQTLEQISLDKDSEITELKKTNAAQADTIAKESGSKAYAKITTSLGFESGVTNPSFWLGGAVGAKIGRGFLLEVGGLYKVGTFDNFLQTSLDMKNLMISTSIGWEW